MQETEGVRSEGMSLFANLDKQADRMANPRQGLIITPGCCYFFFFFELSMTLLSYKGSRRTGMQSKYCVLITNGWEHYLKPKYFN